MPRLVVHSLPQAVAALAAAAEADVPVSLESPPEGARSLGAPLFLAIAAAAADRVPAAVFDAVLDCGEAPGLALAALRSGARNLRIASVGAGSAEAVARLSEIAAACGAQVLKAQPAEEALDLDGRDDPLAAARDFLRRRRG